MCEKGHRRARVDVLQVDEPQAGCYGHGQRPNDGSHSGGRFTHNLFHESQVDNAQEFDDARAAVVHADGHEGVEVHHAGEVQEGGVFETPVPHRFEAREDVDEAEDGAAGAREPQQVVEGGIVQGLGTERLVLEALHHEVVNEYDAEKSHCEEDHPEYIDRIHFG